MYLFNKKCIVIFSRNICNRSHYDSKIISPFWTDHQNHSESE